MREGVALVAPEELPNRFLVSQLEPLTDEFHVTQPTVAQDKELTKFWEHRKSMLEREARDHASAPAYHALIRYHLRNAQTQQALELLREAEDRSVSSSALSDARLQILCRQEPAAVENELRVAAQEGSLNDRDPDLLSDVARAFLALNDRTRALSFLRRINLQSVDSARLASAIAELWWLAKDEGQAWKTAEYATKLDQKQIRAWNVIGSVSIHQGEYDRATWAYAHALSLDPLFRPALLNNAALHINYLGERPDFDRLRDYVDTYPRDLRFAYRAALYARNGGERQLVSRIWNRVSDVCPRDDVALRIGLLAIAPGPTENVPAQKATRLARLLEQLDERSPEATLDAAIWIGRYNRRSSAEILMSLKSRLTGAEWLENAVEGLRRYVTGKMDEARVLIGSALRSRPESGVLTRLMMNLCLDTGGHYIEAARLGERVLDSDMCGLRDWNNAIYAHLMSGNVKAAAGRWKKVSIRPAWGKFLGDAYYAKATQGLLLLRMGGRTEGEKYYRQAAKMAPPGEQSRVLQKLRLEMGRELQREDMDAAKDWLNSAVEGPDRLFGREARGLLESLSTG